MVFRFFKVACVCARPENGKQTLVSHPLFLLNSNPSWLFGLSQNSDTCSHYQSYLLLFLVISMNTSLFFKRGMTRAGKGVNTFYCAGPVCVSHVWLIRLILRGQLWIRKHCHYSVCCNIPHGCGTWFFFNKPFFHSGLTIAAVSNKSKTGPQIRDTNVVFL